MENAENIMSREVAVIEKNKGLNYVVNVLATSIVGSVVITDKGKPIGIITERDIIKAVNGKKQLSGKNIDEIMKRGLVSVSRDTSFSEIHKIMTDNHIRHLPVIENSKVLGMIGHAEIVNQANEINWKNAIFMKYQNIQTIIIVVFFIFLIIILLYKWTNLS
jgi:predicted transcriptional regulator